MKKGALQQTEVDAWLSSPTPQSFKCPACGFSHSGTFDECPKCGIIISKYQAKQKSKLHPRASSKSRPTTANSSTSKQTQQKVPSRLKNEMQVRKEKEILQIAKRSNGRLTIPEIVAGTSLNIAEAEKMMEEMVSRGYVGMHVTDSGITVYEFGFVSAQPPPLSANIEETKNQSKHCPYCGEEILAVAKKCKHCGEFLDNSLRPRLQPEIHQQSLFEGPPINCRHCGGPLKKERGAASEGAGCLIFILGLIFTPLLIGIPLLIYGLHLMSKREGFWRCKECGEKFPREIKWYEFG